MTKTASTLLCVLLMLVWSVESSTAQVRNGLAKDRRNIQREDRRHHHHPSHRMVSGGFSPARVQRRSRNKEKSLVGRIRIPHSLYKLLNSIFRGHTHAHGNSWFPLLNGNIAVSFGRVPSGRRIIIYDLGEKPTQTPTVRSTTTASSLVLSTESSTVHETKPWRGKGSFTGDLRLSCMDRTCTKGVVEVYNSEANIWGTICANGWGTEEATMVCNFLKFSEGARRPLHLRRDRIPKASRILPSFYQNITCTGTEDSIIDCGGDKASSSGSCQPDLIAGVKCAGKIIDNRESVECRLPAVRCKNKEKCIPSSYLCDGMNDCPWGTDEQNCHKETCPSGFIQCGPPVAGCVSKMFVCNGKHECSNGKDEANCGDYLNRFFRRDGMKLRLNIRSYISAWRRISPYACAKKCIQERLSRCATFDYNKELHECYLASKPLAYAAGMTVPTSGRDNWSHYVLKETFGNPNTPSQAQTVSHANITTTENSMTSSPEVHATEATSLTASPTPIHGVCGLKPSSGTRRPRAVGGVTSKPHDWPWQAGIWMPWKYICGGTLIASCWVLSAAHCFTPAFNKMLYTVRVGDHYTRYREGTEQYLKINQIIRQRYNRRTHDNDISLIKLQRQTISGQCAVFNSFVQPACIPTGSTQFPTGHQCYITGWGHTSSKKPRRYPTQLQEAKVPLIHKTDCIRRTVYGRSLTNNMLCAGFLSGGVDTCQGDSGGPLTCFDDATGQYYVWGVVSWGHGCARPWAPGIYTNVHNYRGWIRSVTRLPL